VWSFAGDGALVTAPLVVNNYVFIGSSNGNLYALDGTSGAQLWTKNLGAALPAGDGLLIVPAGQVCSAKARDD
jgi:outer membrane protein assembly factor BamB